MNSILTYVNHYHRKISRSIRGRGIFGSINLVLRQYYSRFRFRQLDFRGRIEPPELDGPDEVRIHAMRYEASNPEFFRKLFKDLKWNFEESIFVDFGCGKGASLVFASGYRFKKLIGVEFSKQLAESASENIRKHCEAIGRPIDYDIINTDAGTYEIPHNADCFYFFNPFDAFMLAKVLHNIVKSVEMNYRKVLIVYMNAVHSAVFDNFPFTRIKSLSVDELDIYYTGGAIVYTNG
jgi:hypothetical protein